jgi:hypothetical protein
MRNKSAIILLCKKLMSFYKGNFNYDNSFYKNKDEVLLDIDTIRKWGDIASVRKCCNMYQDWYFMNTLTKIDVIISEEVQEKLKIQEQIKKYSNPILTIRKGKYLVEF